MGNLAIALQAIKEGCSEHLTDADVVCITSNLSDLVTKRQVTYNWVQEAVAFWSNSVFSDSSTIYVGPAEMTGEVSAVAELSSVETGTWALPPPSLLKPWLRLWVSTSSSRWPRLLWIAMTSPGELMDLPTPP